MFARLAAVVILVCGCAFGLPATATPAAADPVYPQGSRVGIEPLPGMVLSPDTAQFRDPKRSATLTILDLPAVAYAGVERSLFAPPDDPEIAILGREPFFFRSGSGFLVRIRLKSGDATKERWALVGRGAEPGPTALVTFEVDEADRGAYSDAAIRQALASVSFRPPPVEEQLALFPMRLTQLAGFRIVQVHPALGVLLTDGPLDQSPKQPTMLITLNPQAPTNPDDRSKIAQDLLRSFGIPELRIVSAETIRLKNQPTFEVRAEARDPASDTALSAIQWMRFSQTGYLRIVAAGPKDDWADIYPRFRAVRDGLQPR
ncbi:MAG TPA: hypothetical protein VNQ56_15135 [Pseudolabrys sp.]|nr:hypothetical protein [Pseudolabrys sp.]